jgi:hypothetical protein
MAGGAAPKQKEWRTLPWLPGYEISESGDVRHTTRKATRPVGYVLKGCIQNDGYRIYKIPVGGTKRILKAHRLACEAFHGPSPNVLKREVAHNDGNPGNNHFTNLRWAGRRENDRDRVRHGTDPKGDRNGNARFTWDQVRAIRARFTGRWGEITAIAREYGVSVSAIAQMRDGRHWHE